MAAVVLGIDYGTKRVGLAYSIGTFAEPLEIVSNQLAIPKIQEIIEQYGISQIVLGISEGEMAEKTKQFAKKLKEATNLPVEYYDETMSSVEVHQKLHHAKKSKKRGNIDHFAATQILQAWLDEQ